MVRKAMATPICRHGQIINISSVAGLHAIQGQALYCASKCALAPSNAVLAFAPYAAAMLHAHAIYLLYNGFECLSTVLHQRGLLHSMAC